MSQRYSISFSSNESELEKFFIKNGKSKIAKTALKFYIENKDKVINEATINLLKALSINNQNTNNHISTNNPSNNINKFKK